MLGTSASSEFYPGAPFLSLSNFTWLRIALFSSSSTLFVALWHCVLSLLVIEASTVDPPLSQALSETLLTHHHKLHIMSYGGGYGSSRDAGYGGYSNG